MKSSLKYAGHGLAFIVGVMAAVNSSSAAVFSFTADPFAGSAALTTPGRQVAVGEPSITFNPATDVFAFDTVAFGLNSLSFANNVIGGLSPTGLNTIVLRTFDDDGNAGTVFGAGNAANLIAGQTNTPGPGFFIYFNSNLDLARLVYSTDLNDVNSDLKIVARMTNLAGQPGRDALAGFTAANFQLTTAVPDNGTTAWLALGALSVVVGLRRLLRPLN